MNALKEKEFILLYNESCDGSGVFNYSIRGRCHSEFFQDTVKEFLTKYGIYCDGLRPQWCQTEWCVIFSTPRRLYDELFKGQHEYVICQVPTSQLF